MSKVNRERRKISQLPETLRHGRLVDIAPLTDKRMLDRPNWRFNIKSKWKDSKALGFVPSYKDFGRLTVNGFHKNKNGKLYEPTGKEIQSDEKYNPYINSSFDIGHKFRRRVSQKEISPHDFNTFTRESPIPYS